MSERRDEPDPRGVELWLAPFLRDPTLWPVAAVVACIAVTFGAAALLLAAEGNLMASAAAVLFFWVGFDAALRQWRAGSKLLAGIVAGFWALSGAAAALVHHLGWF